MMDNMRVEIPCSNCAHKDVCIHKGTMKKCQDTINSKFYGDNSVIGRRDFEDIDSMKTAKITVKLQCGNYLDEDVI